MVFVDAAPAELRLAAATKQTAAVGAQNVLHQIGEVVGCEVNLTFNLVSKVLLGILD